MLKRQKADPKQLCFVFEGVGVPDGARADADGESAGTPWNSILFTPPRPTPIPTPTPTEGCGEDGRGVDPAAGVTRFFENAGREEPGVPFVLPPGTPPSVLAAHASTHLLSGPDPGLTALCASWLDGLDAGTLAKKMTVVWNRRFASAAGVARYGPNRIELNPALVRFPGEIERTLRHEVAHLLARFRNPSKKIQPHGAEWRRACVDLGIPGEPIYHNLPFKSRRRKRNHAYRCASCAQVITRVRPLKGYCACYTCCKKFSGGSYDVKFKLEKVPSVEG